MKKIIGLLTLAVLFTGCVKDEDYTELTGEAINAVRFSAASVAHSFPTQLYVPDLSLDEQRISLSSNRAKFEGSTTAPEDIALEYKINPAALAKYNADNLASDPSFATFELLPDSAYSINVKTDVIKKGEVYAGNDSFNVVFFPQKINTTINYILPLTVTSAKYPTAASTGTMLYYLIGNPLAGTYNWAWKRFNTADTLSTPTTASFTFGAGITATFVPVNATTVEVQSGYADQNGVDIRYQLSFTNTAGVLSNFSVKIKPEDVTDGILGAIGALSYTEASILIADPVNKHFRFTYAVVNGAGAPRVFIDEFHF